MATDTQLENVNIVTRFIKCSPPGEINDVFNDVRILLNNDALMKKLACAALRDYNKDQFTPVSIHGSDRKVLLTEHNDLGGGTYFDDRTQQIFKYDDLKKEVLECDAWNPDPFAEPWRADLDFEMNAYLRNHYSNGVCSIFGKSRDKDTIILIVCLEDHNYQPRNFWNGSWRSQWTVKLDIKGCVGVLEGEFKIHVHYYENGNVQLVSSKTVMKALPLSSSRTFAVEVTDIIQAAEDEYQIALTDNYKTMSDTTFKALRRQLPVTRAKLDWNKLLSYNIIKDLKIQ